MEDKVFLITGASSGIGAATARSAAKRGYRTVLAARRAEILNELCEELGGPTRSLAVRCDVTQWEDQQEMIGQAIDRFGRIDVVLANAGVYYSGGGFADGNPERWKEMILTNVYGAGLTIRASLAALKISKGHILLLGFSGWQTTDSRFHVQCDQVGRNGYELQPQGRAQRNRCSRHQYPARCD